MEGEDEVEMLDNFSSKACYDALEGALPECNFEKYLWRKDIPNKVSFIL